MPVNIIVVYNKKSNERIFLVITGKEMHSMCPNALVVDVDKIQTSKSQQYVGSENSEAFPTEASIKLDVGNRQ